MSTRRLRLFDVALNLTDPMFYGTYRGKHVHVSDMPAMMHRARDAGVDKALVLATTEEDTRRILEFPSCMEGVQLYATVGVHPTHCAEIKDVEGFIDRLARIITQHQTNTTTDKCRIVAVGECGLDYDRLEFCPRETQVKFFELQFKLAQRVGLPMLFHNRNTGGDFVRMVKEYRSFFSTGIVHSYTGGVDEMRELIKLGLYIGINGCSLKTEENLQVAKQVPREWLIIETDAPWCDVRPTHASSKFWEPNVTGWTPVVSVKKEKFEQGKMVKSRNEPCMTRQILEILAKLRGEDVYELGDVIYQNTMKAFGLDSK